jgi:hypothetical protein
LVIDPNTVLAGVISAQPLKPIARRHAQIVKPLGDLQLAQLAPSHSFNVDKAFDPSYLYGMGLSMRRSMPLTPPLRKMVESCPPRSQQRQEFLIGQLGLTEDRTQDRLRKVTRMHGHGHS